MIKRVRFVGEIWLPCSRSGPSSEPRGRPSSVAYQGRSATRFRLRAGGLRNRNLRLLIRLWAGCPSQGEGRDGVDGSYWSGRRLCSRSRPWFMPLSGRPEFGSLEDFCARHGRGDEMVRAAASAGTCDALPNDCLSDGFGQSRTTISSSNGRAMSNPGWLSGYPETARQAWRSAGSSFPSFEGASRYEPSRKNPAPHSRPGRC